MLMTENNTVKQDEDSTSSGVFSESSDEFRGDDARAPLDALNPAETWKSKLGTEILREGSEKLSKGTMDVLKKNLELEASLIPGERTHFRYDLDLSTGLREGNRPTEIKTADALLNLQLKNQAKNPTGIKVEVILQENGLTLVKVGPCDLSGMGGHDNRKALIKNLVTDALTRVNSKKKFEDVNVSACVGVRGRSQMVTGLFKSDKTKREQSGTHMNAYIKTKGENDLTHWEPREGPQGLFNDTICAMVVSVTTSLFEQKVMSKGIPSNYSSKTATIKILKNPELKKTFDLIMLAKKGVDQVKLLIDGYKKLLKDLFITVSPSVSLQRPPNTTFGNPEVEPSTTQKRR